MPRGRTARQPKKSRAKRAGRPLKYNHSLELTAAEVLTLARVARNITHSADGPIPDDAVIETKRVGAGFRYVIRWSGVPAKDPSYQGSSSN